MKEEDSFRIILFKLINENPGLHFREIQRRLNSAVGKLDYNLYQLERDGKIFSKRDGRNVRYFSNESDTVSERKLAVFLRSSLGREILIKALKAGDHGILLDGTEKLKPLLDQMRADGIIEISPIEFGFNVKLKDRSALIKFLKKYGESFIDSLAASILKLLDEF
ncbi:MAG: hypothetical protein ACYCSG_05765 [Thermoplasmataceae archaeon]